MTSGSHDWGLCGTCGTVGESSSLSCWSPACSGRIDTRFPHRVDSTRPLYSLLLHIHSSIPQHTQTDGGLTPARRAKPQRAHVPAVPHARDHARRHALPVQDPRCVAAGGRALRDLLHAQLGAGHAGRERGWERDHERGCKRARLRRDWRDEGRGTLWKRARWRRRRRGGDSDAGEQLLRRRTP